MMDNCGEFFLSLVIRENAMNYTHTDISRHQQAWGGGLDVWMIKILLSKKLFKSHLLHTYTLGLWSLKYTLRLD